MFNPDLVDDLARERVVLFLGAGVSASAVTAKGGRIAGWPGFLKSMANAMPAVQDQALRLIEKSDFLLACEILQVAYGDDWGTKVADEFGQKATPSELHKSIIALRQRLVLTTNFDKLLEAAWEAEDKDATHYPTVLSKVDEASFKALKDHGTRYIIKIHGTVDDAQSLVFSRSEYVRLAFGNANYSSLLESLLLNHTFLFIGFSMDDPAITSLMEMYALRYKGVRPHYIFASQDVEPNIVDINKRLRKLITIPYDTKDNHAALPGLVRDLAIAANVRRKEIYASHMALA